MTGGEGVTIGPVLLGAAQPVRNADRDGDRTAAGQRMTALAVVESMER